MPAPLPVALPTACSRRGAALVYAIDVGYGQLDWSLRSDSRVHTLERTNIRFLTAEKLYGERLNDEMATLAVADLSFISVTKVLRSTCST
jgi:23S rRNA (cytidine1920-2'-O)/16S rRNA (cytidine1409-2'-O)-methyltransferase